MVARRCDLASEHGQAYRSVNKHERKHEEPGAPEHKGEARMGCGCLLDGDRERDHVGPKRDRQRSEGSGEDECNHVEWRLVLATANAYRQCDRGSRANDRTDEQVWPL